MVAARPSLPSGSEPRVGPLAQAFLVAAILVTTGVIVVLYGGPSSSVLSSGVLPYGTPLSPQTCSNLESTTDLDNSLASLYNGYSLQGYQAGQNGTPALGISSYPSLPAGQAALNSDWTSICESGQFGYAFGQANGTSGFFSGGELAEDGHYVFFYGFGWQDACPSNEANSTYPCGATATWTVDLVTDSVLGPSFTNVAQVPLGAPMAADHRDASSTPG